MCRNIKVLYNFEPPATEDEVRAAATQYVRKISGFAKPSEVNRAAFERAFDEIATASSRMIDGLVTTRPKRDREQETAKAHARGVARFGA
jgi:hypothetical protein